MKFYKRPVFWVILLFVYSIILVRHANIGIYGPGYGRGWYYGDDFSDRNVESASKFYLEKGFAANNGMPTYFYQDDIPGNEVVYTHYPPMAEWIGGGVAKITGDYRFKTISFLPLILSLVLFFMIFNFLSIWLKNDKGAFVGAAILVLSNYFIAWADDTHQHLYVEFLRWSFAFFWWKYLVDEKKNYLIPIFLAFCYAMMCFFSFEEYVYIAVLILGFPLALKQRIIRPEVIFLLSIPLISFATRLWINVGYLGSVQAVISDMKSALDHRTGVDANMSELGRKMTTWDYLYYLPKIRLHRLGHFYIFPTLVVLFLALLGLLRLRKNDPAMFRIALVIYIASISWMFVMPQHAFIHIFTLRHLGIFIGIAIGTGLLRYKEIITDHWARRRYFFLAIHSVVFVYSIIYISINTIYFLYLKFGLLYPNLGVDKFEWTDHFMM